MLVCTGPTLIGAQLDYPFPHLFPTYLLSSWLLSKKKKNCHISLMSHQ